MAGSPKKMPDAVDQHVGSRVRMRRLMVGMSQEKLAGALGLTFQQIQKYEKGTNRIGASRLHRIGSVLGVPVDFFYDGAPGLPTASGEPDEHGAFLTSALTDPLTLRLVQGFSALHDDPIRRQLVELVESLRNELAGVEKPARAGRGRGAGAGAGAS